MEKNQDFVANIPWKSSTWRFNVRGKAKYISETQEQVLEIIKKLFETNENFFIPTRIRYALLIYSQDGPVNTIVEYPSIAGPADKIPRYLESDAGLSYQDFKNDILKIDSPKNAIRSIGYVELSGKVKIYLNGKDVFIDCHSPADLYSVWDGEKAIFYEPLTNPLSIEIMQSSSKGENKSVTVDDPAYYDISYDTHTDIWFEDNEIGRANCKRLRQIFDKIQKNFEVVNEFSQRED
jgi:hypothetical protein